MRTGRPPKDWSAIKEVLLDRLHEGKSLFRALEELKKEKKEPPSRAMVYTWLNPNNPAHDPDFLDSYVRARRDSADLNFERIEELVEDVIKKDGIDPRRARVAINALDRLAAKKHPKKYTDRFLAEVDGRVTHDRPHLDLSHLSDAELVAYKKLHAKIRERNDPDPQ